MKIFLKRICSQVRGASLVEFALLAPVFLMIVFCVAQLGILLFASSGIKSAVAEGARYASVYPRPANEQIVAKIRGRTYGLDDTTILAVTAVDCTSGGRNCVDIAASYNVDLEFIFFDWPTITLNERRRAFVHK